EGVFELEVVETELDLEKLGELGFPFRSDSEVIAGEQPLTVALDDQQLVLVVHDGRALEDLKVVLPEAQLAAQPIDAVPQLLARAVRELESESLFGDARGLHVDRRCRVRFNERGGEHGHLYFRAGPQAGRTEAHEDPRFGDVACYGANLAEARMAEFD